MATTDARKDRTGTQAIQRCAALLRLITTYNRTGMRLVDLHNSANLTRPTAHRLLQALVAEGFVRQDDRSKRYFLGSLTYEMGVAAAAPYTYDLRDTCVPYLRQVADATGDTVFLTVRSGLDGVCIARAEGAFPIKVFVLDVGRRRPLNVGAGATALLSALPDDEIQRICLANKERTERGYPRFSWDDLRQRIARAREQGYLENEVLEVESVRSIAVPILDPHGRPIGAVSISALSSRLKGPALADKVKNLQSAVHAIEEKLRIHATDD
ncbi:IclR family transcriptional regulator [Bordetella genomosp. 7]|uniref:IclR family transcriptional regulator n=1 Tax=Bordetella genomosp. 7 TaxID=1416805 RepID=A0A261QUA5_9BORD|nr:MULTISPECIES: IclR family transcriptional regulator [Bordetella]OZI16344.1 IclR family transcriptional regulator [Bordetella genomosp. 7]OZI17049.1 IclR family transcriptional regulator [Bordetella genomosp. 7]